MAKDDLPDSPLTEKFYAGAKEWINAGDSAIVDPHGTIVAGPAHKTEEILYAEIDSRLLARPKWMLDVAGHYGRPDVFELRVNSAARPMLTITDRALPAPERSTAADGHETVASSR